MQAKSQTRRLLIVLLAILCLLPSLREAQAVIWGNAHGMTGKALRDGLDFWAGGFLATHGHIAVIFDQNAYDGFLRGLYGKLPVHLWSYPPNYLLIAATFGGLAPWHAVLTFDALSLLLLVGVLRLAPLPWLLILAVAASPASLDNILEGQNAALLTALIGGGILIVPTRPRLGGALIGLASIKPQLGLVLPLFLVRRAPLAFLYAALAAVVLAAASLAAFGAGAWGAFWHITRPAMSAVLITGKPPEFAAGLISVFAACRGLGVHAALLIQSAVTLACIGYAATRRDAASILILAALASPYLHDYDLLGVSLAVALLIRHGLQHGFAPGEPILLFLAWFGPGLLPWAPQYAHATPIILLLLLASAARSGAVPSCDSHSNAPGSSVGPPAIPAPPNSTVTG
jgi:alpha-1,2-mannosyltransferase